MRPSWSVALFVVTLGALGGTSCMDPVHSDAVDALGPEAPGVRRGPQHRPGQPCTVCHGGDGPGSPEFIVAGTVFAQRGSTSPASGVTVTIKDATGAELTRETNGAGNFYVLASQHDLVFPLQVTIAAAQNQMTSRIGRSGSCATCHQGNGDSHHVPAVYMRDY